MITVKTMGGLGNQMFQYAFGLSQASRLQTQLQIDRSRNKLDSFRPFNLDLFTIPEPIVEESDGPLIRERSLEYDPMIANERVIKNGDVLLGYWQSEKYFESVASTVRERFVSHKLWSAGALEFADRIKGAGDAATFVCVRRGDYFSNPRAQSYHGNLGLDWYTDAIEVLRADLGENPVLFVFSDEIAWVKEYWDFGCDTRFYTCDDKTVPNHIGREDIDMGLMSMCSSAIIPNSSFAWWGAWLGDRDRSGLVVAPKNWFKDPTAQAQSKFFCPDRWIRL